MLWKRVIVAWMTLLALVFASAGASARTDVGPKPHVGAIDLAAAICIEAHGLASAEGQQGNWDAATTETSDVRHAARALPAINIGVGQFGMHVATWAGGCRAWFVVGAGGKVALDVIQRGGAAAGQAGAMLAKSLQAAGSRPTAMRLSLGYCRTRVEP